MTATRTQGRVLAGHGRNNKDAQEVEESMNADEQVADVDTRVRALLDAHDPASCGSRDFLAARFDAGLAWVHFPLGCGGLGLSPSLQSRRIALRRDGNGGANHRILRKP
jgi:hypothetical protein